MKILTLLIISLATFILGYSVAEYTDTPLRSYIIQTNQGKILAGQGNLFQITLKNLENSVQYISHEKPSEIVKSIPIPSFLEQIDPINVIQKKQNIMKIIFQNKDRNIVTFYALPISIMYDKENNKLQIEAEKYMNIKSSNESKTGDQLSINTDMEMRSVSVILPY
jgi:hypothetical protein